MHSTPSETTLTPLDGDDVVAVVFWFESSNKISTRPFINKIKSKT